MEFSAEMRCATYWICASKGKSNDSICVALLDRKPECRRSSIRKRERRKASRNITEDAHHFHVLTLAHVHVRVCAQYGCWVHGQFDCKLLLGPFLLHPRSLSLSSLFLAVCLSNSV